VLRDCRQTAELRLRRRNEKKEQMRPVVPILGKWLMALLWMTIPQAVASILSNKVVTELVPNLGVIGDLISLACNLVCVVILWKLSAANPRYRYAAFCLIAVTVPSVGMLGWLRLAPGAIAGARGLAIGFVIAVVGLGLAETYCLYTAHAEVLTDLDDNLAATWRSLWKWFLGLALGCLALLLILFVSVDLAMILLVLAGIGLVVVWIIQLITLYHTAKTFRNLSDDDGPASLPEQSAAPAPAPSEPGADASADGGLR
jgi:hypothetical protein